jgi:3D (Asp-Asp-Asp) domain-containing protein
MKNLLIYLIILTTISVPQIIKTQKNIDDVKPNSAQCVIEPLKQAETDYPIKSIPEPQTEQETALETVVERLEEESKQTSVYLGRFELTAYCSCYQCCGEYALNRPIDENGDEIVFGSIGQRLYQGVSIAVDPKVIPYGSTVLIGSSKYIAHDCGGAIKGNKIDIYFNNHSDARSFGRQHQEVYLLAS